VQVKFGELFEAARPIKGRSTLISERYVVDEAVRAGRGDGLFVQAHRVGIAAVNARDLGANELGAVFEVFRTVLGPLLELAMVGSQCLLVRGTFRVSSHLAERSSRQRTVEFVVCPLKYSRRYRRPKSVRVSGRR